MGYIDILSDPVWPLLYSWDALQVKGVQKNKQKPKPPNKDDTASCSYQFFISCIMKAHRTSLIMGQNLAALGVIPTQNRIIFSTSSNFWSSLPVFLQYCLSFEWHNYRSLFLQWFIYNLSTLCKVQFICCIPFMLLCLRCFLF